MRTGPVVGVFAVLTACLLLGQAQHPEYINRLAPFVSSPSRVVDRMLELARLKPGETLYDLGSGDGRIVITAAEKYKAKAIGVEISPKLVERANSAIQKQGLGGQVRVVQGDILEADISTADVVTLYLESSLNAKLRPRLEKSLRPGARVVSYGYMIPGWKPSLIDQGEGKRAHALYLYEMPAAKN